MFLFMLRQYQPYLNYVFSAVLIFEIGLLPYSLNLGPKQFKVLFKSRNNRRNQNKNSLKVSFTKSEENRLLF